MPAWRRFERVRNDTLEFREVRHEGIRCFLRWGPMDLNGMASTAVLDDDGYARRHAQERVAEWLDDGFTEVAPPPESLRDPHDPKARVLDVLTAGAGPHAPVPDYQPIEGFDGVYCHQHAPHHPMGFTEYFVLRDQGRSAVRFAVLEESQDPLAVADFLDFVCANRDLPFDGASHHKREMPLPAGPFTHALFCAPSLGQSCRAYPEIAASVATAFPIHDCEIGNHDPEVLVDTRIHGRHGIPYSDWGREPHPVIDVRYDVRVIPPRREDAFRVHRRFDLEKMLRILPVAAPESWVDVRSFTGEVRRLTPREPATIGQLAPFLYG